MLVVQMRNNVVRMHHKAALALALGGSLAAGCAEPAFSQHTRDNDVGDLARALAHASAPAERNGHAMAFLVTDGWQGRGLGALMLSRLVEDAEQRGISTLVAEVLPGNRAMIAVFERSGYPVAFRWDAHGVEVEIGECPLERI